MFSDTDDPYFFFLKKKYIYKKLKNDVQGFSFREQLDDGDAAGWGGKRPTYLDPLRDEEEEEVEEEQEGRRRRRRPRQFPVGRTKLVQGWPELCGRVGLHTLP